MRILDLYIARTIMTTTLLSLLVLLGLNMLIQFVDELGDVGKGSYEVIDVLIYVVLSMPLDLEDFFPPAALLGGLLGLGTLASSSELVVMRAAGLSKTRIAGSVMMVAMVLVLGVMAITEWITPRAEFFAKQLRTHAIHGENLIRTGSAGIWARDENTFVHIGEVITNDHLQEVTLYIFNPEQRLEQVLYGDSAKFQEDHWLIEPMRRSILLGDSIEVLQLPQYRWFTTVTPSTLNMVALKAKAMSIRGLVEYINYLSDSNLDYRQYSLTMWRKAFQPITIAVMMLLAMSFVFGSTRSGSMGARLIIGVITGFGYFLLGQMFGPMSQVFNMPTFLAALMPPMLFSGVAVWLLRRGH